MTFDLPFPPAEFSGHNNGSWYDKSGLVAAFRLEARVIAQRAARAAAYVVPATGDISIRFTFVPPDMRSDRVNMPGRLKPQIDGIADALKVNDRRFLPSYSFAEPEKPGRVIVEIGNLSTEEAAA